MHYFPALFSGLTPAPSSDSIAEIGKEWARLLTSFPFQRSLKKQIPGLNGARLETAGEKSAGQAGYGSAAAPGKDADDPVNRRPAASAKWMFLIIDFDMVLSWDMASAMRRNFDCHSAPTRRLKARHLPPFASLWSGDA
jgi:hypothetical protein